MKTLFSELADMLGQIIEITPNGLSIHLDRRTLSNVGSQFRSLFI